MNGLQNNDVSIVADMVMEQGGGLLYKILIIKSFLVFTILLLLTI